jgi:hypothetical protein
MLRVTDRGLATAYLSVPLAGFAEEWGHIKSAFDAWKASGPAADLEAPEVLFLLGQADMAIQFRLADFRRLFELRYPYPDSIGLMFNWHYAVPYDFGDAGVRELPTEFRFLLHLRMHRRVHAYPGIEELVLNRIAETFRRVDITADVNAGLGWSDAFVNGYLKADHLETFVQRLLTIDNLHIEVAGSRQPVFSRVFSILGYPWENDPMVSLRTRLTLLRVAPGSIPVVHPRLVKLEGDIRIVEGKSDLAVVVDGDGPSNFLALQRFLAEDKSLRNYIQKVETHLVFSSVPKEGIEYGDPLAQFERKQHLTKCSCEFDHKEVRLEADAKMDHLPTELRHAVQNMMLLLNAAVRDETLCCDVRNTVIACERSLVTLLKRLEPQLPPQRVEQPNTLLPPDFRAARDIRSKRIAARLQREKDIYGAYRAITDWHMWAERILKQRTVGSFDELFGQSDRAITYNGGVQKFLFLADALIDDFVRRIDRIPAKQPLFATLYDSVQTILALQAFVWIEDGNTG